MLSPQVCMLDKKYLYFTVCENDCFSTSTAGSISNTSPKEELSTSKVLDTTVNGYEQTYSPWDKTTATSTGSVIPTTGNLIHCISIILSAVQNDVCLKPHISNVIVLGMVYGKLFWTLILDQEALWGGGIGQKWQKRGKIII